jgi:DNA-directed RNA polymerase specialized sigma24 family protein
MRPCDAFDRCLDYVRRYQANQHRIPAIRFDEELSGGAPVIGNARTEYIAEFALCGRHALKPWPKRYELFEVYFVRNVPYTQVLKVLGIKAGTLDFWSQEIKKAVGRELQRRGLYPPGKYTSRERNWREEIANGD